MQSPIHPLTKSIETTGHTERVHGNVSSGRLIVLDPAALYFFGYPAWALISRICRMCRCECVEIINSH